MSIEILILLIVVLPLFGGLVDILFMNDKRLISPIFVGASFLSSLYLTYSLQETYLLKWKWLIGIDIGIQIDKPAVLLLVLVTFISLLVHIFSLKYIEEGRSKPRYFSILGFFTFSMLGLLISDSLILLFVFWELVGFASYLLIGFWFTSEEVAKSARTAFMVNRIADVALLAGILILYINEGTASLSELTDSILFIPSFLIVLGAFGKSAQLPFSGWLVKAMVGPTPVSALIHAATMVAAGVYLLYRVGPFMDATVLVIIAFVGTITAFYGAISAITQNDIKKILAYSTISQLGYMVLGIGVGTGESSLFHLWTHAFFKGGLFLNAGVIIHHLHQMKEVDGQDMRLMGGLRKKLPWTFFSFFVCGLALAGIPFLSGFMSKEVILIESLTWAEQYGVWAYVVPDIALITVLLTAFYVGRLMLLVFWGESRLEESISTIRWDESNLFRIPTSLMAFGCVWFVYAIDPFSHTTYINSFLDRTQLIPVGLGTSSFKWISIFLSISGLTLAYFLFKPGSAFSTVYKNSEPLSSIGGKFIHNGFYVDRLYSVFGSATFSISRQFFLIDKGIDKLIHVIAMAWVVFAKVLAIFERLVVDGVINFTAWTAIALGKRTAGVHARESQWQILWLLIAFVLILVWFLLF